jgi:indolepyruvate ferredoxin oxidoreductase
VEFLTAYQNAGYARGYSDFVEKVRQAEAPLGKTALTEAVARYLFKLMAYKDEYEVARLHTGSAFAEQIGAMFEGDYTIVHHLAPPLFSRRNDKGELVKRAFGPWVRVAFRALAGMKCLRGSRLDIFGYTHERRTERGLIQEYRASIEEILGALSADRMSLAVELASIPQDIRGLGHVKARHLDAARPKWQALLSRWRA